MGGLVMELGQLVLGLSVIVGPVVVLLMLLNLRDRRVLTLRDAVLGQLALPELRGRFAVQIRGAVFSGRRTVTVDMLACTRDEVWDVFARLSATLPPHVRLLVHGAIGSEFTKRFTLKTTIRRPLCRQHLGLRGDHREGSVSHRGIDGRSAILTRDEVVSVPLELEPNVTHDEVLVEPQSS